MNAKKVFGYIAAMLMLLPMMLGAFGSQMTAHADDPTTADVTLHKVVFEDELPSNLIQNTGEEMDDFEDLGGKPLEGATFEVYDVTEQYYEYIAGGMTAEEALDQIEEDAMDGPPRYGTGMDEQVTDADGMVTFEDLPLKDSDGRDNVYLFIETDAPADIKQRAMPIALAMPIYKVDANGELTDELNTDIHLYPKNVSKDDTKELNGDFDTVKIGDELYNFEIGAVIPYRITVTVPTHIENLEAFTLKDVPAEGLVFIEGSLVILYGSDPTNLTELTEGYTVHVPDPLDPAASFIIEFDPTSNVWDDLELKGKELYVDYEMKLTEDIDPDEIFDNTATLTIGDVPITIPGPSVATGGHRFVKTDAHKGNGLEGAEFIVKKIEENGDEKYATFDQQDDGEWAFTGWVDDADAATDIVSDENGVFNIIGLTNGTYFLIETKAPSNRYVQLKAEVEFEVEHGPENYANTDLTTNVKNTPKGRLPLTGGPGILIFLAVGLALMISAVVWNKKTKNQAKV